MLKAVILGNTNLGYSWFVKTFKQGLKLNNIEVYEIDYKSNSLNNIKNKIINIKPNFVFTHLSFHQNIYPINQVIQTFKEIKNKIDVKIVHTCNDARTHDRYMGDIRGSFDLALVGSYPLVENCQKAFKIPVFYCPYSSLTYDKMADFDANYAFKELVFTGSPNAHRTGWKDNRANFIERLKNKVPLRIFQTQSENDLRGKTPQLSVSCSSILGACVGYEIPGYIDVRPFQYLGTGALMIMRKFNEMDKIIPNDLYWEFKDYSDNSIDNIKELYKKSLIENTTKLKQKAFDYIQFHHSSKKRIENVLHIINQI